MSHEYGTTKVLKLETKQHGGFEFQTTDAQGTILFKANGVIHEIVPDQKIIRTFEMANSPFEVQLEFLEFIKLSEDTSKLSMQIVFRTPAAQRSASTPTAPPLRTARTPTPTTCADG